MHRKRVQMVRKSPKRKRKAKAAARSTEIASSDAPDATLSNGGGNTHVLISIVTGFITILQNYLLPLLVALVSWLFSLVFGKKKKQQ